MLGINLHKLGFGSVTQNDPLVHTNFIRVALTHKFCSCGQISVVSHYFATRRAMKEKVGRCPCGVWPYFLGLAHQLVDC